MLARAEEEPDNVDAQLAAAYLATELLEFGRARKTLDALLARKPPREIANRALHQRGRLGLLDLANPNPKAVLADFGRIEKPTADLELELPV